MDIQYGHTNHKIGAFDLIIPVVLAGGTGSRLWPLSNALFPKQYLSLGDHEYSMLQETLNRVRGFTSIDHAVVVSNSAHQSIISQQLSEIGLSHCQVILEPIGKNTAPAIALAAFSVLKRHPDAKLLILPSDHLISDIEALKVAVSLADERAQQGQLVTFGIKPTYAETGYGYINSVSSGGVAPVKQFVEKPNKKTAEGYLSEGTYYWNSGMFLFQVESYLNELSRHQPEICIASEQAFSQAQIHGNICLADKGSFSSSPSCSIDYAVMEKTSNAVMVPLNCGWTDIGSWSALFDYKMSEQSSLPKDGNLFESEVFSHNSKNNYVNTGDTRVSLVGVENLIIVQSEQGILITTKDQSQNVGHIVKQIKSVKK